MNLQSRNDPVPERADFWPAGGGGRGRAPAQRTGAALVDARGHDGTGGLLAAAVLEIRHHHGRVSISPKHAKWIPWLKINYTLGVDGISLLLVLLTTLIMPLCVLARGRYIRSASRSSCSACW
jgi:hypothetical protein